VGTGRVGSQTGNRQDRAFGGLVDNAVSAFDAVFQRGGKLNSIGFRQFLHRLAHTGKQQGSDNARVAVRATRQRHAGFFGDLAQTVGIERGQILDRVVQGHGHIRTGIAVGDGEDV